MAKSRVGVGLLGMGVVGSGVARVLSEKRERLRGLIGSPISLEGVLVRDVAKLRSYQLTSDLLTTNVEDILSNPNVDIVVEVIGGQNPALDYILKGISLGKHIVTANKEVMAQHGPDILTLARKKGVQVLFEASVAGGTPIIAPLLRDLVANEVITIHAIINGTTNYILTRMASEGVEFGQALKEAQELGYAEADPTNDVEGIDAAYKLAILSTLAFHARVKDADIHREGITRLEARDFLYAKELGYAIKPLAITTKQNGKVQARVHPAFVREDMMIAKVDGVLNAVEIETDLAGRVLFHGRGAGSLPTTSAVMADIVNIARNILGNVVPPEPLKLSEDLQVSPMQELETKYYLRLNVADRPGVLAQIAMVLGDLRISIASVIQKETDEVAQRAEIVLMTPPRQRGLDAAGATGAGGSRRRQRNRQYGAGRGVELEPRRSRRFRLEAIPRGREMVRPKQLGHLVLRVRDLDRSEEFYTDVLGLTVTSRLRGNMVFLSAGEASHELALMSVGPDAPGPEPDRVGLYHFAWEMETFEDVKALYKELKDKSVEIGGTGDHGISLGVYFFDPDGNEIEAFYELPRDQWPKEGSIFGGRFPLGTLEEEPAVSPA